MTRDEMIKRIESALRRAERTIVELRKELKKLRGEG
jgi:hypothetical protein|nr:MAG TPA: coiled-coil domain-containing protein [Caudoviricetes sp.]